MLSMSSYILSLPMPAGREAFLTRAGMVFCQLWQAFEKTLGCPSATSFALRRFSLVPLRRRALPADAAGHHARSNWRGFSQTCQSWQNERGSKRSKIFTLGKFCVLEIRWHGESQRSLICNLTIQIIQRWAKIFVDDLTLII